MESFPRCRNCQLYDRKAGACQVQVMIAGEPYELPVQPDDECHWLRADRDADAAIKQAIKETPFREIRNKLEEQAETPIAVKEATLWSDGKKAYFQERG